MPSITLTHVINPFRARAGSEHDIASRLTWRTLEAALSAARTSGQTVKLKAVIAPGDEAAVPMPSAEITWLARDVRHCATLKPARALPLIADLLKLGAQGESASHIVFTNMDIAVHAGFYQQLEGFIRQLGEDVPFTVARVNIDPNLAEQPLTQLYAATGDLGHGYDCFVIPRQLIEHLDLGQCCIGAPHFDLLLYMALDLLSGHRVKSINDAGLTFHLGNEIAWSKMLDHEEHNLRESLAAIARMSKVRKAAPGSVFDHLQRRHFARNNTHYSAVVRKVRRIPGLASLILGIKHTLGRQY